MEICKEDCLNLRIWERLLLGVIGLIIGKMDILGAYE